MSGFSITPNLGLKKPITGADDDLWGTHWNNNADVLDTTVGSMRWGILPVAGNSPPTNGGAGYAVGDVITLTGGATVSVITVTAGAVTEFQVQQSGSYTTLPAGPMAQTATTGVGTGFTVTPPFGPVAASIGAMPLSSRSALQGNFVLGYQAGFSVTTGAEDVFIGPYAGLQLTTGNWNTALGHRAMGFETTGNGLTAVGLDSMRNTRGNSWSTAFGSNSIRNWNGNNNTAVGTQAMYGVEAGTTRGDNNIAFGFQAMKGVTASSANYNIAIGNNAASAITTAANTLAVGHNAALALTSGSDNSLFGHESGIALTTGHDNTFLGIYTGKFVTTGAFNTLIGSGTATTTLATGTGNIVIGTSSFADTPAPNTSNMLVIQGNSNTPVISATGLNTATPAVLMPGALTTGGNVSAGDSLFSYKLVQAGAPNGGSPGTIVLYGAAGEQRGLNIYRGLNPAWTILVQGATDDLNFGRWNDAGAFQGNALSLIRATGAVLLPALAASTTYANDAAAAAGGVAVGQLYRNGSAVMCRVT